MNILLCGADGFLGRHFEAALVAAGHTVWRGVHTPRRPGDVAIDYRRDLSLEDWQARLIGMDAVINAVGILNEAQPGDFDRLHHQAPAALFAACGQGKVARVIQISALGAERRDTPYLASKAAADDDLLAACPGGMVVRPALVFGPEGTSSRFFLALASLPIHALPGSGEQRLRPIHIDDLTALVLRLIDGPMPAARIVHAVGGEEVSYRQMLAAYRHGLGLPPAMALPLPNFLMGIAAAVGDHLAGSLFNRASWRMLQAGNTADAKPAAALLGRAPRAPAAFIAPAEATPLRLRALADWRGPLLRGVLAFLWLWSAMVSLAWPQTGLDLLAPFGLHGLAATVVLVGASACDAAFGWLTLRRPGHRLWQAQIGLIAVYSLLIAFWLPAFLIHPFAPVVKNVVVVALLFLLWSEEVQS